MPWAVYYGSNGFEVFLKIISKTFFCYWMFWFAGLHIKDILTHKNAKLFFSISWLVSILMIILNALSNEVFNIILDGKTIYLMLGDTFAILSIFAGRIADAGIDPIHELHQAFVRHGLPEISCDLL